MARYYLQAIIALALALINLQSICSLEFKELKYDSGMMFIKHGKGRVSYDTYKILYNVDITAYKNITIMFGNHIKNIEKYCENKACQQLLEQFENQLRHMKRDEFDIEAYQHKNNNTRRNKRHIQFIGTYMNWAFGLIDTETAKKYEDAIEKNQIATSRYHNLIDERTIFIKEILNVTDSALDDFDGHVNALEHINKKLKANIRDTQLKIQKDRQFVQVVASMKFLVKEHHLLSTQIIGMLEKPLLGKITQLVSFDDFARDLIHIHYLLKDNQRFPIDILNQENPLHILKFSTTKCTLYGNKILVEIKVPIIERQIYSVYEVIPIPTIVNDRTLIITPTWRYMLINDMKSEFIPIKNIEFSRSKFNLAGEKIITPDANSYTGHSESCEIQIFTNAEDSILKFCDTKIIPSTTYFVPININDIYYVSIPNKIKMVEYCYGSYSKDHVLHSSGFLRLTDDCHVSTDKIHLMPRSNYKIDMGAIELINKSEAITNLTRMINSLHTTNNIPTNIFSSLSKYNETMLISDPIEDFKDLVRRADELIEKANYNQRFENAYDEIFKHSNAFIAIVIIAMILAFIVVYLFLKKKLFSKEFTQKLNKKFEHSGIFPKGITKKFYPKTPPVTHKPSAPIEMA